MARLLDTFSSFVSFGLGLDASIAADRAEPGCESARQQALNLLEEARTAALALGRPAAAVESARFAMVAWIDEILARHPGCKNAGGSPLQLRLFNSSNAASEFFHHLSTLTVDDDEVREVYWRVLALGFKGQYYFENDDSGELGKLKALHAEQLALQPAPIDGLAQAPITPQPDGLPGPPGPPGPRDPRDPLWRRRALLRAGGALALLVPLAYALWFMFAGSSEAPLTLAQRIDLQLQAYACADLSATVAPDGQARVQGFVSNAEEMVQVQQDVRALPGVSAAEFDLQLRIWPHCEVLALLKPYQARNRELALGLAIATPTAPTGRLREGDRVLIEVTNARRDGYLWVDYYTADGAVLHLNAGPVQLRLTAGETIELGRDIPSSWLAAPPFGTVLVTALSSPMPFAQASERPPFELASAYLQRLRESLAVGEFGARAVAEMVFLETVPR
ncbi:DotU family type IV/VI secretion system protein [Variovorax ginsengisoli]|uniref:DotU family type IV/VI secretion system protein n=1 Tax=Variovorax ginsengisoli TaxID=363844 RepID=A0ABT8S8W9_9BURK|nr:DotU family type IV/VI secretion system protein [Variovorax ginsengisoli]MDN8614701.1 DotU family type IV/VI secretion system protein [Variovorax ginsengisoli]MDO1533871.1 DotU family type IV/VI secretion system protein [Variovorax ginsengisoli]